MKPCSANNCELTNGSQSTQTPQTPCTPRIAKRCSPCFFFTREGEDAALVKDLCDLFEFRALNDELASSSPQNREYYIHNPDHPEKILLQSVVQFLERLPSDYKTPAIRDALYPGTPTMKAMKIKKAMQTAAGHPLTENFEAVLHTKKQANWWVLGCEHHTTPVTEIPRERKKKAQVLCWLRVKQRVLRAIPSKVLKSNNATTLPNNQI